MIFNKGVEALYYRWSENKGTDHQVCGYLAADPYMQKSRFSHDTVHINSDYFSNKSIICEY